MILFTSFTATTSFYIFDVLNVEYGMYLFVIGFVFTSLGQYGLMMLMQKYNRNSYIIFSIGAVVGLSAILMGLQSAVSLYYGTGGGGGSICDAAA
jgi:surface polysaccharide O-acyltransferase-like enzyme